MLDAVLEYTLVTLALVEEKRDEKLAIYILYCNSLAASLSYATLSVGWGAFSPKKQSMPSSRAKATLR